MKTRDLWPLAVVLIALTASAQSSDAAYCQALTEKYQAYIANMNAGRTPQPGTVDARVAIEQCQAGNAAAGIPVLEKKLRDAKITLPLRS